ncbi:MAG TPA: hypothetical protein P5186_15675 [Candidatus Paceibacterota bacterium]|nr:hypothetical protein [Verrucomicrobiota bacterium]HRY49489.1 hypothetical protein [Candidatus Paceibacterota bacterium]HSA03341.1 hypothetical protein [Candidatus Paceibacterota bacterium]
MTKKIKILVLGCVLGLAALLVAGFIWIRILHHGPRPGMLKDIHAGLQARHLKDPDQRILKYLEIRYGSMSDPAHRQDAFLDFFNIEHIKTLQLMVKYAPESHRQEDIHAMARWVADYRDTMTPNEKAALNARLQTAEGQTMLRRATAQYNSQDVRYRGHTAPVISQLLRTLNEVEQGR